MIMQGTVVPGTAVSNPFPLGTMSTGTPLRPPQPGISTLVDARWLDSLLDQVLEILTSLGTEQEVPEVFDLQSLERRRVTLRVQSVRAAEFYFVDDGVEDVDL